MPYVEKADRAKLESYITDLSDHIAKQLSDKKDDHDKTAGQEVELGKLYKNAFMEVAGAIISRESGNDAAPRTPAQRLGQQIFDVAKRKGGSIRVDWLGNLNYCITRLIQITPRTVLSNHGLKSEFGHPLYLITAGALEQCALEIRTKRVPNNIEWVLDGLVGVLFDIEDEYKRRVNIAYEAVRIKEVGDAYDAPFRTEVVEFRDGDGKNGYTEIMMDFDGPAHKKAERST